MISNKLTLDEFVVLKKLGSGGQGSVLLGEHQKNMYAIKLHEQQPVDIKQVNQELKIIQHLSHPNVIKVKEVRENSTLTYPSGQKFQHVTTIMEYFNGMQVYQFQCFAKCEVPVARALFRTMLGALEYIHSKGITHRDIKPQNILVNQGFEVKIIDFGFASPIEKDGFKDPKGSPPYVPPQLFLNQVYRGEDVDIFALAVVTYNLVMGLSPFFNTSPKDGHYHQFASNNEAYWKQRKTKLGAEAESRASKQFINLMNRMLHPHPEKRMTIEQLKADPWVNQETYNPQQIKQLFRTVFLQIKAEKLKHKQSNKEQKQKNKKQAECGVRSNESNNYEEIKKMIKLDPSTLKTRAEIYSSDYVVDETPIQFLVELFEFLCYKKTNVLLEECEEEIFVIETEKGSDTVTIQLGFNQFGVESKVKVNLRLSKTVDNKLNIQFLREGKDDRLISYKLIYLLKSQFEYLKSQSETN